MENKKQFEKIVEKNLKNVLTINFSFGIITKSLVTKRRASHSINGVVRTLTNKQ